MTDVEIEFITSDVLKGRSIEEKMRYILDHVKDSKILVIEESLSAQEEVALIEETMRQVNKKFQGLEVSTLRERAEEGIREKLIKLLGGSTGGITVIGPSKLVKKIKKEPQQITMLAGEASEK